MIERHLWLAIGVVAALAVIWHGMTTLIGDEIMVTAARGIATAGVFTVQYGLMIGIPVAGAWGLFLVCAAPIGWIKRFLTDSREQYARVKAIEADAMAVIADAKGRYRQSQYITVAGRSALAIDTQTGRHKWYAASASMDVEEPEFSPNLDAQFDATQLFEQIYQRTNGQQNAPSLIIAGRKRSGKSTFAEWITHRYADEIDFVLIDPKQDDPLINWGPTTEVLARNSNWREFSDHIDQFLEDVKTWRVDRNRKKRIYIIDEWLTVSSVKTNKYGEKFFDFMQRVLTEMAYLGVGVILLPHATTATALKFPSGYAQLRDCFDGIFRFKHNLLTGQRTSYFEFDGEETQITLWNPRTAGRGNGTHRPARAKNTRKGPLEAICAGCASVPNVDAATGDWRAKNSVEPRITDFFESRQDKYIIEAHRAGLSRRRILESLNWPVGGRSNEKLNRIFEKYGVGTEI